MARAIRQQPKGDQGNKIEKEEVKLSLSVGDMIVYISDHKISARELLQLINTFSNETGHKNNLKASF